MTYYVAQDGEAKGPYTLEQLRSMWHAGIITSETQFCIVGRDEWQRLKLMSSVLDESARVTARPTQKSRWRAVIWALAVFGTGVAFFAAHNFTHQTKPAVIVVTPKQQGPKIPVSFEPRLTEFVREATKLSTLTGVGVSNAQYRGQYVATLSAYKMLSAVWPDKHATDAREKFEQAMEGWKLVLSFWERRLAKENQLRLALRVQDEQYDTFLRMATTYEYRADLEQRRANANYMLAIPYAYETESPFIEVLENYAHGRIIYSNHDAIARRVGLLSYSERDFDKAFNGAKKLIHYDDNIRELMTVASEHFNTGTKLMEGGR